jgi:hypothetical protein
MLYKGSVVAYFSIYSFSAIKAEKVTAGILQIDPRHTEEKQDNPPESHRQQRA